MDSRFTRLWTASTISNLGDGVVFAAFPLIVASLTRDPFAKKEEPDFFGDE